MNNQNKSLIVLTSRTRSFLFISIVLLSSVVAIPGRIGISIAQKPEATSQEATRAAAQRLSDEGAQLLKQGTAESLRRALEKYKQALPLWQQVRDKRGEATTLLRVGRIYDNLGEKQQALNYYNQSLPLWRQVGDKGQGGFIPSEKN